MRKTKRWIVAIIAFAGCMGIIYPSHAQVESLKHEEKEKKNTIGVIFSLHEFFDGNPVVQPATAGTLEWMNLAFGLEYARMFDRNNGFGLAATWCGLRYVYLPPPHSRGDLAYRYTALLDLYYQRRIVTTPRFALSALGGVNYRHGDELVLLYVYYQEAVTLAYPLRDWGISGSMRGSFRLFWNVMLNGQVSFTQYIYRYAKHHGDPPEFRNRPTSNMALLQIGLGYQF